MGVHHAPQPSSHAARLAGRGALTAAAALALAGGTASLAFASEAPSVPTTHDIQGQASHGAHELQDAAKASPLSHAPHVSAHDASSSFTEHAAGAKSAATHAASTLKDKAPSLPTSAPSLPTSAPSLPTSAPSLPTSLPIAAMKTDAGHFADNTKADVQHAATNWSAAAKGGLTAHEASDQLGLMSTDVTHAVSNGKADATHWGDALTGSAPQLGSVLSFT